MTVRLHTENLTSDVEVTKKHALNTAEIIHDAS